MKKFLLVGLVVTVFLFISIIGFVYQNFPRKIKVYTIKKAAVSYNVPIITNKDKFLNDLMLCPYWKVEKERNGTFRARARSLSEDSPNFDKPSDLLLFSFKDKGVSRIPEHYLISNEYMSGGNSYSSFTVDIIFSQHPEVTDGNIYQKDKPITLDIFEFFKKEIGPNSYSTLVFSLSDNEGVYLLVHEQGSDLNRKITFAGIPGILEEVERINKLPESYSTKDVYKDFFSLRFGDQGIEKSVIKREPGLQDRDTFYGYFPADQDVDYDGINVKISHPIYCNGECTNPSSRVQKAEYIGKPYVKDDSMYFQIEDNAVYLGKEEYDRKFGTFSGSGSFEGKLEILNKEGKILYETNGQFRGWER